jgi:heavy metal efflux system protein
MIETIIGFSIRKKWLVLWATLVLVIWGIWSFTRLPIDAIPDITNNQVQVLTVCPSLATPEVEQFVTAPVETAIRTIPGIVELRSISRFGLSVITVVFEEDLNTYLVRQLVNEKINLVKQDIPEGFGEPELAPTSTGLGEILHYRIEPMRGFEHKYSTSDLRTIQDWVVKRQLLGTPGVVEVNSFGGHLKQYEVAFKPDRLRAAGISVAQVFDALEKSNQNSGGAYIEKHSNAYFIRSEGLIQSLDDLRRVPIQSRNGIPVCIGDIAEVKIGHAVRYGAVTHKNEGEIVLGIVMMLKGANAAEVIGRVKERLSHISTTLPEGVQITTFLDRENLVNRTIKTVRNNLIEGALIVILILVLLVGNLRAGLLVASIIPLSMLFAIGMMQLTGVSANLMSLGAVDFGLIVDGAVIIVEATLFYLSSTYIHGQQKAATLSQSEMDSSVFTAASGIMRSSVFGVLIILIVYLPILALTGIEGKMFRPMAQTVSFALIGALILSLTWVPALSAWVLDKKLSGHQGFADKMIHWLECKYLPLLGFGIKHKKSFLAAMVALLLIAGFQFSRMGGEFIPTLDEGDIMMHGFCKPGTSLSQTIESHSLVQKIIKEQFPDEVEQMISKIGTAEIPTDPMAPETADNIILLKPKDQWKRTKSKAELVNQIEEAVKEVPGMAFEFTQPIKMRFDEMMTGVRSDIAVKIFGENLDSLSHIGNRIGQQLSKIEGLEDIKVEQLEGLPQLVIRYDYAKIARYGLHVKDLNTLVNTAFAGAKAGVVLENERRFDLVLRMSDEIKNDVESIRQLPVPLENQSFIPLHEIANIDFEEGAAQISRDNGQRRVVISANVRAIDVETAISRIKAEFTENLKLPVGYNYTFGGQFQNLQAAKQRLSIAVPVALLLIFLLLFLNFNSLRYSAIIFSAIPMSAIGGVWALILRDMPFSISAGVGFIALFGVAVLNGIVMLSYFKKLESDGVKSVEQRIIQGARTRLRPVIMTAAVASLGFLPMAYSTGAGAEVQQPLATVVIGGLISATLLTLLILPVLYAMFIQDTPETH